MKIKQTFKVKDIDCDSEISITTKGDRSNQRSYDIAKRHNKVAQKFLKRWCRTIISLGVTFITTGIMLLIWSC